MGARILQKKQFIFTGNYNWKLKAQSIHTILYSVLVFQTDKKYFAFFIVDDILISTC